MSLQKFMSDVQGLIKIPSKLNHYASVKLSDREYSISVKFPASKVWVIIDINWSEIGHISYNAGVTYEQLESSEACVSISIKQADEVTREELKKMIRKTYSKSLSYKQKIKEINKILEYLSTFV